MEQSNRFYSLSSEKFTLFNTTWEAYPPHGKLIVLVKDRHPTKDNVVFLLNTGKWQRYHDGLLDLEYINGDSCTAAIYHKVEPGEYVVHPPDWLYHHLFQIQENPGLVHIEAGKVGWLRWDNLPEYNPQLFAEDEKGCWHLPLYMAEKLKGVDLSLTPTAGSLWVLFNQGWKNRRAVASATLVRSVKRQHETVKIQEYNVDDGKRFNFSSQKRYIAIFPQLQAGRYSVEGPLFKHQGVSVSPCAVTLLDWTDLKVEPPYI